MAAWVLMTSGFVPASLKALPDDKKAQTSSKSEDGGWLCCCGKGAALQWGARWKSGGGFVKPHFYHLDLVLGHEGGRVAGTVYLNEAGFGAALGHGDGGFPVEKV